MLVHMPDHFSSKFRFDFKKKVVCAIDRSSLLLSYAGWFFGSMLLALGIYELFSFIIASRTSEHSFFVVEIFAFFIIVLALGIIFFSTFSFVRYKKFEFDGKNFKITYHPAIGVNHTFTEPLENYIGVRLRVLFTQSGILNKNRYIIDLYHQDSNKIIPLYISTKNKKIRKFWEHYAKFFNLPALSVSDRGVIKRECVDLDKSIKELYEADKLPFIDSGELPEPESLILTEKAKSTSIKPAGIYWDIFSSLFLLITFSAMLLLIVGAIYLTFIGTSVPTKYWVIGSALLLTVIFFSCKMFSTYDLEISAKKVSVSDVFCGIYLNEEHINVNKIENVELSYNPTIDRYSLAIISDDKVITFGSRLPVGDLIWLRDFVIRKLIGN